MSKSSHNRGLMVGRIVLAAASIAAAGAKDTHTEFGVSTVVRAVAHIEVQSAPANIKISAADLRRGFVEVLEPTRAVIRSNSQSGFALDVMTVTPMLSSMVVEGLNSDLELGAQGGTIVQRWQRPQVVNLSLRFRFSLAPGLAAGEYPWPLRIAVRPLESN